MSSKATVIIGGKNVSQYVRSYSLNHADADDVPATLRERMERYFDSLRAMDGANEPSTSTE